MNIADYHYELFYCYVSLIQQSIWFPSSPMSLPSLRFLVESHVRHVFCIMELAFKTIEEWLVISTFVPILYHHILQAGYHCR